MVIAEYSLVTMWVSLKFIDEKYYSMAFSAKSSLNYLCM